MLDLAYRSLTQEASDAYLIGPVSDSPGAGYLWHYWMPWMAMLDRDRLRLRHIDQVLAEGSPFAYPLELRWEFIEWARRGMAAEFLTPHIPPGVLDATRAGKAIILLFFGHEARPLAYSYRGRNRSAYDLIFDFLRRHNLPTGSVWFVSGNLAGRPEYELWKGQRLGSAKPSDPFEVRFIEPYSYLAQAMRRAQERGFDLAVESKGRMNPDGSYLHQAIRVALIEKAGGIGPLELHYSRPADALPSKLFLCMNRRPHEHRRAIVCHLLRRGLLDCSLVSFRDDQPQRFQFADAEMEAAWQELQRRQPLTIDRDLPLDTKSYFQDNAAAVLTGDPWPYRDSCFSIVTETHFANDRLFVSEKLWKPIMNAHPFIAVGTPGTLAYLRSLGFRTFMPAIDERYDLLVEGEQRMRALFDCVDALGALDAGRRAAMLEQMRPILAHNERHLRQLRAPMARLLDEIEAKLMATG